MDSATCAAIAADLASEDGASRRHLIDHPQVVSLLTGESIVTAVLSLLGNSAFAYKATLFDKSTDANWLVAWHQDVSIPVSCRIDMPDWRGWSRKDDVDYVLPPDTLLAGLLAVRIHLDDCDEQNGPLRVVPGSDADGRLSVDAIRACVVRSRPVTICGTAGSALFMRPLLVHASSKATSSQRRRVLHIEFAAADLPFGLEWHRRVPLQPAAT